MNIKLVEVRPLTDEEEAEIQRQITSDPDALEVTDEELTQARLFREMFPELGCVDTISVLQRS